MPLFSFYPTLSIIEQTAAGAMRTNPNMTYRRWTLKCRGCEKTFHADEGAGRTILNLLETGRCPHCDKTPSDHKPRWQLNWHEIVTAAPPRQRRPDRSLRRASRPPSLR